MKKNLWLLACLIASMIFVSCGDDDDPVVPPSPEPDVKATTMYFINEGSWSVPNSASFCSYNTLTTAVSLLEEPTAKIGDTPQDMLIVGSKIYVSCWGSKGLLIVDVNGSTPVSNFVSLNEDVRYLAYKAPYLYISCYGGRIMRYNTANGDKNVLQTSGKNLEGVAILGDKLYACNSYSQNGTDFVYYNNLVTVDLNTFTEGEPITTVTNPNYIVALDGALYVLGFGNYGAIGYMLAKVNPATGTSTDLEPASKMCVWNNQLLYAYTETDWTTYASTTTFTCYNPATGSKASVELDNEHLGSATIYMLEADPYSSDLYVGVTDYVNSGKIYRFAANKTSLGNFSSEGISPSHAVFYNK